MGRVRTTRRWDWTKEATIMLETDAEMTLEEKAPRLTAKKRDLPIEL